MPFDRFCFRMTGIASVLKLALYMKKALGRRPELGDWRRAWKVLLPGFTALMKAGGRLTAGRLILLEKDELEKNKNSACIIDRVEGLSLQTTPKEEGGGAAASIGCHCAM